MNISCGRNNLLCGAEPALEETRHAQSERYTARHDDPSPSLRRQLWPVSCFPFPSFALLMSVEHYFTPRFAINTLASLCYIMSSKRKEQKEEIRSPASTNHSKMQEEGKTLRTMTYRWYFEPSEMEWNMLLLQQQQNKTKKPENKCVSKTDDRGWWQFFFILKKIWERTIYIAFGGLRVVQDLFQKFKTNVEKIQKFQYLLRWYY